MACYLTLQLFLFKKDSRQHWHNCNDNLKLYTSTATFSVILIALMISLLASTRVGNIHLVPSFCESRFLCWHTRRSSSVVAGGQCNAVKPFRDIDISLMPLWLLREHCLERPFLAAVDDTQLVGWHRPYCRQHRYDSILDHAHWVVVCKDKHLYLLLYD